MNKNMSTTYADNKGHERKGKSLAAFNTKKIFFKSCKKFKIYFLLSKTSFLQLHFYNYTFPVQFSDVMVVHQAARLHYQ